MRENITVKKIAQHGKTLMQKAKLHHHFFGNHSLYINALYLAYFALNLPHEYHNSLYLNKIITEQEAEKILKLYERRITERVPVEYITQEAIYSGHKFYVNNHVLVPRSLMNTQFSDFLNKVRWENYRVLDLCTGSGCIGITLALMNPHLNVDLADISPEALEVAETNIKNYNLESRVKTVQTNLFENIKNKYDLIISNPPYVSEKEYRAQPLEVKNEPKIALLAGVDGADLVNKIITQSKSYLNPEGLLICEVGYACAKILKNRYSHLPIEWRQARSPAKREPILDKVIRWSGLLDSLFLCNANGLPFQK
ncbi:MAG TPA: 50S ribosomal protein L3 N(5)-glutamine methyltransferase [Gammaproteobacteria bacterium]|nr:50S ribosomal protein L3 N(5)-glutamine methyltransferase [Gammaproteobacteria bacterium]